MILGKIMMLQFSSKRGSVEYQISKKSLQIGTQLSHYTLKQFLNETGVSKTSLMRYLSALGVPTFTRYREVIASECSNGVRALKYIHHHLKETKFSKDAISLATLIQKARRVFVLGDGNCFELLVYVKALIHLDIDIEVPVYLGKEEEVFEEYQVTQEDLVIIISLHESYSSFLNSRVSFYLDVQYLTLHTCAKLAFIGEKDHNDHFDYHYWLKEKDSIWTKKAELDQLFEEVTCYLAIHHELLGKN